MKLGITTRTNGKCEERVVQYDGKPECRYQRVDEYEDGASGEAVFGCRVIWCYYQADRRVATVLVSRANGEIKPAMANRLCRCWPARIEIGVCAKYDEVCGRRVTGARKGGVAWLTDGQQTQGKPLVLKIHFADEILLHPADDDTFDALDLLDGQDRTWIQQCDDKHAMDGSPRSPGYKGPARAARLSSCAGDAGAGDIGGRVPKRRVTQAGRLRALPAYRKSPRMDTQPGPSGAGTGSGKSSTRPPPYSKKAQVVFAELWQADRESEGRPQSMRNFLADNEQKLKEIGVVTIPDGRRIRDAARKNGLIRKWNRTRTPGKKIKQRKSGGKLRQ